MHTHAGQLHQAASPLPNRVTAVAITPASPQLSYLELASEEVLRLNAWADRIAKVGGPDVAAAATLVEQAVADLVVNLSPIVRKTIGQYRGGELAALTFTGLTVGRAPPPPAILPARRRLQASRYIRFLAARSQVLLALCNENAFAFDIENDGQIVRLVADFSGLDRSTQHRAGGQSSQHGTRLMPHTEGPYHSSQRVVGEHSPAPSSLILTAAWNPENEPTGLILTQPLLEHQTGEALCALVRPDFMFSRSDSYVADAQPPVATSLLELDPFGEFALRFNRGKVSCRPDAPPAAHRSLAALFVAIDNAQLIEVALQNNVVCLINNSRVVHLRDAVADPRRVLVREFGARRQLPQVVLRANPRLVRG
jgi:hypothetical protein